MMHCSAGESQQAYVVTKPLYPVTPAAHAAWVCDSSFQFFIDIFRARAGQLTHWFLIHCEWRQSLLRHGWCKEAADFARVPRDLASRLRYQQVNFATWPGMGILHLDKGSQGCSLLCTAELERRSWSSRLVVAEGRWSRTLHEAVTLLGTTQAQRGCGIHGGWR